MTECEPRPRGRTTPTDPSERLLQSMLPSSLVASRQGLIARLRLSRPAKRNALDRDCIRGIETFFGHLPNDIRVVILSGEGEHFSAGADLTSVAGQLEDGGTSLSHFRFSQSWHRAFDRIENSPVPVLAVLQGAVVGGGLELAAATRR
jgi:enoyl-CoA hydratase/carnithine racemase